MYDPDDVDDDWYVDLAGKAGVGGKGVPITANTPNHGSTPSPVLVVTVMIETDIWQKQQKQPPEIYRKESSAKSNSTCLTLSQIHLLNSQV